MGSRQRPDPLARIRESGEVARTRDLEEAGIGRSRIAELVRRGDLERVGWGLYRTPQSARSEHEDLALVARRVPRGVICLLSALRFHGMTTQNPFEVWVAIDSSAWRPRMQHPPLRPIHMSGPTFTEGVQEHSVDGVPVRVFSPAKTVADCFRFRNRIGTDVAVEALREYRESFPKGLDELWRFALLDRVSRVMLPYLEALG